ncbi:hypothetical protein L2E82_02514 [Cichorium intybus]|uniref:Uncharacterized protein n=1 Tax=Cichorium intybus TaxID=13427 RepID=A0ACB9H2I0_CICIN|nr:hypothetical protein L2E82_02514 [Cichorium intybus]
MGDTENTIPPSKKRAAGRELSRDNPGLDDEEEDVLDQETGTFKKASEEVLANRRIVKVRRKAPSVSSSSNPFASIQLIPPTNSTPVTVTNVQETEKTPSEVAEIESEVNSKNETANEEDGGNQQPESQKEEAEKETKKETENNTFSNDDKKNSFSSFQHLSSSQNAFTGLVGTGFSSSSFSFGSITKTDNPGFPSFGTNGNSGIDKSDGIKTPSMQEVQLETGEENEKAVFTSDSVLFEFLDGGWKERGKGELKVNVSRTGIGKARLVMRARGNYRLILNASIFPDMKLTNMEKKGITFACFNSTGEEKGKDSLSTFALKFKDSSIVEEFRAIVTQHKGSIDTRVSSLKTPENSPKASD